MTAPRFFIGDYLFQHGEVTPVVVRTRPNHHHRMIRYTTDYTMQLAGSIYLPGNPTADPGAIASRVAEIDNVMLNGEYKDIGFIVYDLDGNPVRVHEIKTSDSFNLSGNRLLNFEWRADEGSIELSSTRSFSFVFNATFESAYDNKIDGEEKFYYLGTGNKRYEFRERFQGTRGKKEVAAAMRQLVVQEGWRLYMRGPAPRPDPHPLLADHEDQSKRQVIVSTPTFFGNYRSPQYRLYYLQYRFVYNLPAGVTLDPAVFL